MAEPTGYVLLEDGTCFEGDVGACHGHAVGEVVFTTGMSGYQESMTDPSYAGQLIAFTYPHIGNYGVSAGAMESEQPWARAAIMREGCNREDAPSAEGGWLDWLTDCGVTWITGVDTRALVHHIRHAGAMRGGVFPAALSQAQARALIDAEPPMAGQDLAALGYVVETVRELVGKRPVWGICLGHQLLCRAVGLDTFKLPFGHRGANHPVKDLQTGRVEITSQNHGFAAVGPDGGRTIERDEPVRWETDFGAAALSHVNLYDRTVEGLELLDVPGGTVQYHPEAGPGPHDSLYLFDRFLERIAAA